MIALIEKSLRQSDSSFSATYPQATLTSSRADLGRRLGILLVLLVSVYYGLSLGFHYGVSNQNSYLLGPLHQYDSSLLKNDWITTHSTNQHQLFSIIAVPLFQLSSSGWGFAIINVLAAAVAAMIVYGILVTFQDRLGALVAFMLVIAMMSFTNTSSLSGSYMLRDYFQPSTLGALGLLIALMFFVRHQFAYSGLALAVGGLFHANYLVLGIAVFSIAHLLLAAKRPVFRLAIQLLFPLLAMLYFLPFLWERAMAPDEIASARDTFLLIRAPHHYDPVFFKRQFIPFLSWVLAGAGAFWIQILRYKNSLALRAIGAWVVACLMLIAVGTILTTVVYLPKVAQIQPWRIAPFVEMLCQAMLGTLVASELLNRCQTLPRWGFALMASGLLVLCFKLRLRMISSHDWLCPLVLIGPVACGCLRWSKVARIMTPSRLCRAAIPFGLLVLVLASGSDFMRIANSPLIQGRTQLPEDELYAWARKHSDKDALFITPPLLQGFRLHARRAIVADWKTPPGGSSELIEWIERLKMVCGIPEILNTAALGEGYRCMDADRLTRLTNKYHADYVVLETEQSNQTLRDDFSVVFENREYLILATQRATSLDLTAKQDDKAGRGTSRQ